jgi:hypothetical protein
LINRTKLRREFDAERSDGQWELRETYAAFGRAIQNASVLEGQLVLALMLGEFLTKISRKAEQMGGITKKQYRAELDAYQKDQFAQTMGQIIRRVQVLTVFDEGLRSRMVEAKKRRDFLIHHFWRERIMAITTPQGMRKVQDELAEHAAAFHDLSHAISDALKPIRISIGMDDEETMAFAEEVTVRLWGPEHASNRGRGR